MNLKIVGLISLAVGALSVTSPRSFAQPPPPDLGTRYPKGVHEVVPAEQREALGLDGVTWAERHGKIQPEVYETLKKAEATLAAAKRTGDPLLDPVGYGGTVYIQVQLKHEQVGKADSPGNKAAIKRLQSKVLSQLTAADFYVEFTFETLPGILGYANRAGLEKLKANEDVLAICLDEKPFPHRPEHVFKVDLPPLAPGDPSTQPANGRFWGSSGKTEKEVYQAVALHQRVFVLVNLVQPRASHQVTDRENSARVREIQNGVLSELTADEFWLQARTGSFPTLFGRVNADGLKKLETLTDVRGVGIEDAMIRVPKVHRKQP